jgi:hypothetical protein
MKKLFPAKTLDKFIVIVYNFYIDNVPSIPMVETLELMVDVSLSGASKGGDTLVVQSVSDTQR